MFARYLMIFAVMFVVSACSTTGDDEVIPGDQAPIDRDGISNSALDEIYQGDAQGPVPGSQADLVVNVGDRVFFDYDSYDIGAEARSTLDNQAKWMAQYPDLSITVEGHADERGTREYNIGLSARRAANTKSFLVSQGISASRIKTISFGKERPVAVCDDESCWSQNRRAVTVVTGAVSS